MFARRLSHEIRHWLTPHHSNNFRARLLHNTGFFAVIGLFFAFNLFVRLLESTPLHILGFNSTITIEEVVRLTNQERTTQGLPPLVLNTQLSEAARLKAANMLEENYWAHNSPTGDTPWVWFNSAGYKYTHAGENLAKDFASGSRMLAAWMASPTHKANIVSDKYRDIGVAVVPGQLLGQDTVIVVQLFGSTVPGAVASGSEAPQVAEVETKAPEETFVAPAAAGNGEPAVPAKPEILELKEFATLPPSATANLVKVSAFDLKRTMALMTTGLLILVLLGDVVIAESRKISRRVGKNWAHILFINVILILVTIANAGSIL